MSKKLVGWIDNLTDNRSRINLDSDLFRKIIGINNVVSGVLTPSSPPDPAYLPDIYYSEDWNLVGAVVGQAITVIETSPDFATWIDVLDATDLVNPLFEGLGPIIFTPQAGINYVIRASTENEYAIGAYILTIISLGGWLTLLSPNGSENWAQLSVHNITWNFGDWPPLVGIRIDLLKAGAPFFTITTGETVFVPYVWTIPQLPPGNDYRIRITALTGGGIPEDESDSDFTIS